MDRRGSHDLRTNERDLKNRSDFALARSMRVGGAWTAQESESSTLFEATSTRPATMSA
jgi:hypothetical protein